MWKEREDWGALCQFQVPSSMSPPGGVGGFGKGKCRWRAWGLAEERFVGLNFWHRLVSPSSCLGTFSFCCQEGENTSFPGQFSVCFLGTPDST